MKSRVPILFWSSGVALLLSLVWLSRLGDYRHTGGLFLGRYMFVMPVFFVAWWLGERTTCTSRKFLTGGIVAMSLLLWTPFVGQEPSLSDDAFRYMWEGRLQLHGASPYAHSVNAMSIRNLRETYLYRRVNHPEYSSIYPPLAQYGFALASFISPMLSHTTGTGVFLGWRLLLLVAHIATCLLLAGELERRAAPASRLLLYAWNPLVIIELASSMHLDGLALPLFLGSLVLLQGRRFVLSWCLLLLAGSIKWLPFVVAGMWWGKNRDHGRVLRLSVLLLLVIWLPFAGSIAGLFRSFSGFLSHFESFPVGFTLVKALLGGTAARYAVALAIVALGFRWSQVIRSTDREQGALVTGLRLIALLLFFSPMLHPWYLVWICPLLVVRPSLPLVWFVVAAPLTYATLVGYVSTGVWQLPPAFFIAWTFPIPLFLLVSDCARMRRSE